MKVIQILYSGVGGTSAVAFSLVQGDKKKKWKNIFIFTGKEKLAAGHKELCKKLKIKFHNYGLIKNFFARELVLFKLLIKEKPDCVIVHGFNIFSVILLKKILSFKTLFVEHTPYAYRNFKNIFVDFFIFKFFEKIIYLTKQYKSKINQISKNKKKIKIINNGISNLKRIRPPNLKKKKLRLGMVARFSDGKYQDLLLYSFNEILKINKNLELHLVGSGDNLNKCKMIANNLGINKQVKFFDSIKLSRLPNWFKKIDIYIHLSRDEGLSTIILQAIQLNRPVIASYNDGNKFLINKKGNYAIVVNNNIKSVLKGLKTSLKKSNNYILKHFSSEKMFEKYNNVINEI